jgi:hypothetical protein
MFFVLKRKGLLRKIQYVVAYSDPSLVLGPNTIGIADHRSFEGNHKHMSSPQPATYY